MVMDRAERIGFGTAVGGHALLLGAFAIGLLISNDRIVSSQGIEVSLVEDQAAPGPVESTDLEAPTAEPEMQAFEVAEAKEAAEQDARAQAKTAAEADAKAQQAIDEARRNSDNALLRQKAEEAQRKADAAKKAALEAERKKKKLEEEARRKREQKILEQKRREEAARRQREFEERMGRIFGGGGSNAFSEEVARKAKVAIGNQIRIIGCPSGVDVEKIVTNVTIELNKNGTIASLTNVTQSGRTPSNAPQMDLTRNCILSSIRKVGAFEGLDVEDYASWKSIRIGFRTE